MRLRTSTLAHRHLCPRCVQCGREQAMGRVPDCCRGCGCDFEERPPRSYADLEGLVEMAAAPRADAFEEWRATRAIERWLLIAFAGALVTALLIHAAVSLASALP